MDGLAAEMNYSLCHGVAGNCETLLAAGDAWKDPRIRETVTQLAERGIERFESAGRPWPCGTYGPDSDPSLLLGEAGIGYFYLRLAAPDVPNVLFLTSTQAAAQSADTARDDHWRAKADRARARFVEEYFGGTLRVFARLFPDRPDPLTQLGPPGSDADVARMFELLSRFVDEDHTEAAAMLADAFAPERARYELSLTITDFTAEYFARVARPSIDEPSWSSAAFCLAPDARLIETRRDWDAWLAKPSASAPSAAPVDDDGAAFVVYRRDNVARLWRLNPFALLVLDGLRYPATLEETAGRLRDFAGEADADRWRPRVEQQLRQAYEAGIIACASSDAVPTASVSGHPP
jgi:hypothetical protein